jgi:hypothetical protein
MSGNDPSYGASQRSEKERVRSVFPGDGYHTTVSGKLGTKRSGGGSANSIQVARRDGR